MASSASSSALAVIADDVGAKQRGNAVGLSDEVVEFVNSDEDAEGVEAAAGEKPPAAVSNVSIKVPSLPSIALADNDGSSGVEWVARPLVERAPHWRSTAGDGPLIRVTTDDLHEATLRGDLKLVRRLLDAKATVNAAMRPVSDQEFMSMLHILACKPNLPNGPLLLAEMLQRRADADARSSLGSTPLMFACMSKNVAAAEVLLTHKADCNPADDFGRTAQRCAVMLECPGVPFAATANAEERSVELAELLAKFDANLDYGGTRAPITEAVLQGNYDAVSALLRLGAAPDGLHEAVQDAPIPVIKDLINAEANPFVRNADGMTVMDIALSQGREEVTNLIRDFIGDLEREHHHHLKTLEANKEMQQASTHARSSAMKDKAPEKPPPPLTATQIFWQRMRELANKTLKHTAFQTVMGIGLVAALFLADIWVIGGGTSQATLDILLVAIMSVFVVEVVVQVVALWRGYLFTVFFWMDVLCTVSIMFDHSIFVQSLESFDGLDSTTVVRTMRTIRLAARSARFTKVVKLLRHLPGMPKVQAGSTSSEVSAKITGRLSMQVAILIIFLVVMLPVIELVRKLDYDPSIKAWVAAIEYVARTAPEEIAEIVTQCDEFYVEAGVSYFPYKLEYEGVNGSNFSILVDGRLEPPREEDRNLVEKGNLKAYFNFESVNRVDSIAIVY